MGAWYAVAGIYELWIDAMIYYAPVVTISYIIDAVLSLLHL